MYLNLLIFVSDICISADVEAKNDGVIELQNLPETNLDVFKTGEHSSCLSKCPSRGIHSLWAAKADQLLEMGVMPKKAFNMLHKLADTEEARLVLPTVVQLGNRKRFLFQPRAFIETENDLKNFLRPHMVL